MSSSWCHNVYLCIVIYPYLNCFFFMNVNFHTPIFWNGWTPKSHQMGKKQKLLSFGNKLMTIEVHIVYLSYSKPKKFFFFFLKNFNLWRSLLMITFYHRTNIQIGFWYRRELNHKFLIKRNSFEVGSICRKIFWSETVFVFFVFFWFRKFYIDRGVFTVGPA